MEAASRVLSYNLNMAAAHKWAIKRAAVESLTESGSTDYLIFSLSKTRH